MAELTVELELAKVLSYVAVQLEACAAILERVDRTVTDYRLELKAERERHS